LKTFAADALAYALEKGASACETESFDGYGQTVTVRKGEVETIEYNRDKGLAGDGCTSARGKPREAPRILLHARCATRWKRP